MADQNLAGTEPMSLKATTTVAGNRFIKQDATKGFCIQAAAGTDIAIGVSLVSALANESVPFQSYGKAKIVAGAAVAINAQVTSDATGRAVTVAAGNTSFGMAAEAAGAAGDVIEVFLTPLPNLNGPVNP